MDHQPRKCPPNLRVTGLGFIMMVLLMLLLLMPPSASSSSSSLDIMSQVPEGCMITTTGLNVDHIRAPLSFEAFIPTSAELFVLITNGNRKVNLFVSQESIQFVTMPKFTVRKSDLSSPISGWTRFRLEATDTVSLYVLDGGVARDVTEGFGLKVRSARPTQVKIVGVPLTQNCTKGGPTLRVDRVGQMAILDGVPSSQHPFTIRASHGMFNVSLYIEGLKVANICGRHDVSFTLNFTAGSEQVHEVLLPDMKLYFWQNIHTSDGLGQVTVEFRDATTNLLVTYNLPWMEKLPLLPSKTPQSCPVYQQWPKVGPVRGEVGSAAADPSQGGGPSARDEIGTQGTQIIPGTTPKSPSDTSARELPATTLRLSSATAIAALKTVTPKLISTMTAQGTATTLTNLPTTTGRPFSATTAQGTATTLTDFPTTTAKLSTTTAEPSLAESYRDLWLLVIILVVVLIIMAAVAFYAMYTLVKWKTTGRAVNGSSARPANPHDRIQDHQLEPTVGGTQQQKQQQVFNPWRRRDESHGWKETSKNWISTISHLPSFYPSNIDLAKSDFLGARYKVGCLNERLSVNFYQHQNDRSDSHPHEGDEDHIYEEIDDKDHIYEEIEDKDHIYEEINEQYLCEKVNFVGEQIDTDLINNHSYENMTHNLLATYSP